MGRIIFITGTDTDAGKTVLTGLLLAHLRAKGVRALAIKPFCSGSDADVRLIQALQETELTDAEVNPWFSQEPIAPAIGLAKMGVTASKRQVLGHIAAMALRAEVLLVEGAGGLLAPLSGKFDALELIQSLRCEVLVAGRNRLGCANHFFLTARALKNAGVKKQKAILMGVEQPDLSARTNAELVQKRPDFIEAFAIPWLGREAGIPAAIKRHEKKLKKTLAGILRFGKTTALLRH